MRLFGKGVSPFAAIALSFVTKYILDLLVSASDDKKSKQLLILTALMLLITVSSTLLQKLTSYAESMQNEMLQRYIQIDLMEKAVTAD